MIRPWSSGPATRRRSDRTEHASNRRGQSVVEFAIVLPMLLAFVGLTIDFARVFQVWITLESATRDAAEYAATTATSSADALTNARRTVCLQTQNVPGFTKSAAAAPNDVEQCTAPAVTVTSFGLSTSATGATAQTPLGTATIRADLLFQPLFSYPFITQDGQWTVTSSATFSVLQNRD